MSRARPSNLPTVYVVDPDDDVRDSLRSLLGLLEFPVETFKSGDQLLERTDLASAGCVVTEASLPGAVRGTELARRLRSAASELPVIVISGSGDVRLAVEALRGGAFDFIEKPFVDRVLLRAIEKAVSSRSPKPAAGAGDQAYRR